MASRASREELLTFAGRDPLHMFILETFAASGNSPSLEEIRAHFRLSSVDEADERVAALDRAGAIHRNPGDLAITHAYPFSNVATRHRVRLSSGVDVYAMCAIDALGMPFMLRQDAMIASVCHECGADIAVRVEGGDIDSYSPDETVVWLSDRKDGCVAATDLCPDLNFFCSPRHLAVWRSRVGAKGAQLDMGEAVARGRHVFERLMHD